MRPRPLMLSLTVVAACAGAAAALALKPTSGAAQVASSSNPGASGAQGRYQLAVLPTHASTDDPQWLVLDTETGAVTHWIAQGGAYVAHGDLTVNRTGVVQVRVPKQRAAPAR